MATGHMHTPAHMCGRGTMAHSSAIEIVPGLTRRQRLQTCTPASDVELESLTVAACMHKSASLAVSTKMDQGGAGPCVTSVGPHHSGALVRRSTSHDHGSGPLTSFTGLFAETHRLCCAVTAMPCCAVLCCAVLFCAVLCYVCGADGGLHPSYIMRHTPVLCCTVLCCQCAVLCCAVLCAML